MKACSGLEGARHPSIQHDEATCPLCDALDDCGNLEEEVAALEDQLEDGDADEELS